MRFHRQLLMFVMMVSGVLPLAGMVFDNRFFPLYPYVWSRNTEKPSVVWGDLFYMFAGHGSADDDSVGIPEIFGSYSLGKLVDAAEMLGFPNPFIGTGLDMFALNHELPYHMRGKIETQGLAFAGEYNLYKNWFVGMNVFCMHAFSRIHLDLIANNLGLTVDQVFLLDKIRLQVQNELGFQAPKWSKFGFSDIDAYLRVGNIWEYCFKMKRIDTGVRVGVLIPSGAKRSIDNPASIPFGGNGYWGVYGTLDAELELKEDWKVGTWIRMSKRFARNTVERIPIAGEQQLFGAFKGPLHINPGLTGIIMPYFTIEDIHDGLGVQGKYTVVIHQDDVISDPRITNRTPELQLRVPNENSEWIAEYLTFNLFYDFAKVKMKNWYAPIVSLMWDMPVNFFLSDRVSKTNRVSLSVVVSF